MVIQLTRLRKALQTRLGGFRGHNGHQHSGSNREKRERDESWESLLWVRPRNGMFHFSQVHTGQNSVAQSHLSATDVGLVAELWGRGEGSGMHTASLPHNGKQCENMWNIQKAWVRDNNSYYFLDVILYFLSFYEITYLLKIFLYYSVVSITMLSCSEDTQPGSF